MSSEALKKPIKSITPPEVPAAKPAVAYGEVNQAPTQVLTRPLNHRLSMRGMVEAGYSRAKYDVTAERGVTLEDVLKPEYWVHVADRLRPNYTLEVIAEDGTWYASLLVINADRLWAKVHVLMYHDLTESNENMPKTMEDEYDVIWTPGARYAIVKKTQRGFPPLKDGFQTKLEAMQWLDGHLKTLTA